MDNEGGEEMEPGEGIGRSESEVESLVQGCRSETGS